MATTEARQFATNSRVYHRPGVEHDYDDDLLMRAEAMALLRHEHDFVGKDILDIGAGTGRTAIYLASLANRYEAIDYSPVMVSAFKSKLPGVSVAQADMRDLSRFSDNSFDFVLASNNVFDAVGHDDRLRTLKECARVLRARGTLMFSSHNREVDNAIHSPRIELSRNPVTQLNHLVHWGIALVNHARLRHLQVFTNSYAIINDRSHDCALLHYYISAGMQQTQLAQEGFELGEVFDRFGKPVTPGASASHSRWLLYVARCNKVS